MSSSHLLWIGYAASTGSPFLRALEEDLEKLSVDVIPEEREALIVLAKDPGKHMIVIVDRKSVV